MAIITKDMVPNTAVNRFWYNNQNEQKVWGRHLLSISHKLRVVT